MKTTKIYSGSVSVVEDDFGFCKIEFVDLDHLIPFGRRSSLKVYDTRDQFSVTSVLEHDSKVTSHLTANMTNFNVVITGTKSGNVSIWKITSTERQIQKSVSEPAIPATAEGEFAPDHNLQESHSEPRISLVQVSRVAQFKVESGEIGVMKLEGRNLFIASGHLIQFWNLVHPKPILLTTIVAPTGNSISDFSASPDHILINSNGELSYVKLSTGTVIPLITVYIL